ncbi:hypothetical protein E2542_SST22933 [Spatholobus suberectus]|nr:hypothetical protein E2542_SST22933 [Spatholobus suberectus]
MFAAVLATITVVTRGGHHHYRELNPTTKTCSHPLANKSRPLPSLVHALLAPPRTELPEPISTANTAACVSMLHYRRAVVAKPRAFPSSPLLVQFSSLTMTRTKKSPLLLCGMNELEAS